VVGLPTEVLTPIELVADSRPPARNVALVITSERGLELVDGVARAVQRDHGRLTLTYIVERLPLSTVDAYSVAAVLDLIGYAENWGSGLLRRAVARLPDDISVSTQLLVDSYGRAHRPETVLARGGYEVVIVEKYAPFFRRRRRRLERAFQEAGAQLAVVAPAQEERPDSEAVDSVIAHALGLAAARRFV
jgi:hypothetical protein